MVSYDMQLPLISEEEKVFRADVADRKIVARGARHRKRGSKSKKCGLPSDHMTNKQWKEMCGEVTTYKLNAPMSWDEFTTMPEEYRKEYVTGLKDKFSVTGVALSKMFGVKNETVYRQLKEIGASDILTRGRKMTRDQKVAFIDFCGDSYGGFGQKEEAPADHTLAKMSMQKISLSFSGVIDLEQIKDAIARIIPKETEATVEISVSMI